MKETPNHNPLVWVTAGEVVRCAQLAIENWKAAQIARNEKTIAGWQAQKTGFWNRRYFTREEAERIARREDPWMYVVPTWVEDTRLLGRAAVLAAPEDIIQLSPVQVSWLWPEIDPRARAST